MIEEDFYQISTILIKILLEYFEYVATGTDGSSPTPSHLPTGQT